MRDPVSELLQEERNRKTSFLTELSLHKREMAQRQLPPAQPAFILRGHSAQIHALHFTQGNNRLLTGDADGWVVSWNVAYKRPVAVWRAHTNAILGLGSWEPDRIITHGRDNQLLVWQLGVHDEDSMEKTLPVDTRDTSSSVARKQPWLLHDIPVNAMNFCSFAMCRDGMLRPGSTQNVIQGNSRLEPILFTVPNAVESSAIDIFQLPTQHRAATIHKDRIINTGMVMALSIQAESIKVQVAAGYESGHTMVFVQNDPGAAFERLYCAQTHTQPILSLVISPCKEHYVTSSADANISVHPLPLGRNIWKTDFKPLKTIATKHSGQQGLSYRSDGKILATAGWDSNVRVYSRKTMKEVAVLKWHKEGCYATAFASIDPVIMRPSSSSSDENPHAQNGVNASLKDMTKQGSSAVSTVQQRRDEKARTTHWLATGSKDGKVSLWDIY